MSEIFELYGVPFPARMALRESAARSYISRDRELDEDELYSSDDDEELDDEYWDADELGIDPEDLYDAADGF